MPADHLYGAVLLAAIMLPTIVMLRCAVCAQTSEKANRPSWDEMQQMYPGIAREGPACNPGGQDGCPADAESGFRPTWYGTEDGKDPFADGLYRAEVQRGSRDGADTGAGSPRRQVPPSGDEQYRAAVDAALGSAAASPLDHFQSGTSYTTAAANGPQFARTFVLRRKGWDHHMELLAGVGSDAAITAQELLALRPGRRVQPMLVTGDTMGRVSIFRPSGELLAEFDSGGGQVTALAAVPSRHNATTLLSGHADGAVRKHTIELRAVRPAAGDDAPSNGLAATVVSYEVAAVHASRAVLLPPDVLQQAAQSGSGQCQAEGGASCQTAGNGAGSTHVSTSSDTEQGSSDEEQGSAAEAAAAGLAGTAAAASVLSAAQLAEGTAAVRHIVTLKKGREWRFAAIWRGGGIAVWREDGRLLQAARCPAPVLAARWSEASITMLTPAGGAILLTHLVPGAPHPVVRLRHCGGLGGEGQPQITAAAFDVRQPARAFGATAGGQLLWLSLGHAKTFQNCQVRHSVPASIGPPATLQAGISMAALSQHLVVASIARVAVFDVSVPAAGPVQLFADTLHIVMAALRMQAPATTPPLLSTGRSGPVALGLGSGVTATYRPALLKFEHEPDFSWFEAWSRPLVSVAMLLVAALQIARARRRARRRREAPEGASAVNDLLAGMPGSRLPGGLGQGFDDEGSDSEDISNYEVAEAMVAQEALQQRRR